MHQSTLLSLLLSNNETAKANSSFEIHENIVNELVVHQGGQVVATGASGIEGLHIQTSVEDLGATISDNIYGGKTIDFTDPMTPDIVGKPTLTGESFTQGGELVAITEPSILTNDAMLTIIDGKQYLMSQTSMGDTYATPVTSFAQPTTTVNMPEVASMTFTSSDSFDILDGFDFADYTTAVDLLDVFDFL